MTEITRDIPGRWTALAAVFAVLLALGGAALGEAIYYWPVSEFDIWGLESRLAYHGVLLAALVVGTALTGRLASFPKAVIGTALGLAVIEPVAWYYWRYQDGLSHVEWVLSTMSLPLLVLLWLLRGPGGRDWLRASIVAAIWGGAFWAGDTYLQFTQMLDAPYDEEAYEEDSVDTEALYAAQPGLLDAQIAQLAPQRPGKPDMFALLLGGTSYQSVFQSEVEKVGPILDAAYGSGARTLQLVNSEDAPFAYPMANKANLAKALTAIGTRMGPEDMVFVMMTSHGGQDVFQLSFPEAMIRDLTAPDLGTMLRQAHLGPSVVVLSACHAGSFLDDIAAPDRLVIAAARADRTSFGCANGRDWTEFGQSYFDFALRAEPDPRLAFAKAADHVRMKEFWGLRLPSLPQMQEGAGFDAAYATFMAARQAEAS